MLISVLISFLLVETGESADGGGLLPLDWSVTAPDLAHTSIKSSNGSHGMEELRAGASQTRGGCDHFMARDRAKWMNVGRRIYVPTSPSPLRNAFRAT